MAPQNNNGDIEQLWRSSDAELRAVIGGQSLPLVETPVGLLNMGRRGDLNISGADHLGTKNPQFSHKAFESLANKFFHIWKRQLKDAICKNSSLAVEIKQKALQERDVVIAATVATLSAHIPELQPYAGLLSALAVFIVRSGVASFCQFLDTVAL